MPRGNSKHLEIITMVILDGEPHRRVIKNPPTGPVKAMDLLCGFLEARGGTKTT